MLAEYRTRSFLGQLNAECWQNIEPEVFLANSLHNIGRISNRKFSRPAHLRTVAEYQTESLLGQPADMAEEVIEGCSLEHRQLRTEALGLAGH
jgi:hypothetical protein